MSECSCHGVMRRECDCLAPPTVPAPSARRGNWIQTYSGRAFWPLDPRADEIALIDIAAGLSRECRFGGHCVKFYSTAEHSVLMFRQAREMGMPLREQRGALMHDASEGLGLRDMLSPIKGYFTNYREIEAGVMTAVAERFDFSWPLSAAVKSLDSRICKTEMIDIMAPPPMPWGAYADIVPLPVFLRCWSPEKAFKKFLRAAAELELT